MRKFTTSLLIFAVAFGLALSFGSVGVAQAGGFGWFSDRHATSVDRDLGAYHKNDVNRFGDDRAYNSVWGTETDADYRANHFVPNTYGLMGDYGYDSNGS